jgi:hypothetical protein
VSAHANENEQNKSVLYVKKLVMPSVLVGLSPKKPLTVMLVFITAVLLFLLLLLSSGGPGSIPCTTRKKVVGLERDPLSLVSTTEELLDRKIAAPV